MTCNTTEDVSRELMDLWYKEHRADITDYTGEEHADRFNEVMAWMLTALKKFLAELSDEDAVRIAKTEPGPDDINPEDPYDARHYFIYNGVISIFSHDMMIELYGCNI